MCNVELYICIYSHRDRRRENKIIINSKDIKHENAILGSSSVVPVAEGNAIIFIIIIIIITDIRSEKSVADHHAG